MTATPTPAPAKAYEGLVLAVELGAEARPRELKLTLESAALLGDHVSRDLSRLAPGVEAAGVSIAAALYDQSQLLRPGFPIFAELERLYRAETPARDDVPHIMAFGAAGQRMASLMLEPDARLVGGPLLFVPLALIEHETPLGPLGAYLDEVLENSGLAEAATALYLTEAFSVPVEHARYLTSTDLCALCAVQLEHSGLGAAWQVIETALFAPDASETVQTLAGQRIAIERGRARLPAPSYGVFAASDGRRHARDARIGAFVDRMRELRQYAALLGAHAIPHDTEHGAAEGGWIELETLHPTPASQRALFAHTVRDLGTVALTAAERRGEAWSPLAHGYAATRAGLDDVQRRLASELEITAAPKRLDGLYVDEDGQHLAVPPDA